MMSDPESDNELESLEQLLQYVSSLVVCLNQVDVVLM